jgi:trans-2,3-dihydro-3-hydroxyanthranilate isomerase
MRPLRYTLCDVFTDRALTGNPLCVFTNAVGIRPELMQSLARETNLSETAFVLSPERGGHARVRIFTPKRELPFAGHPILGTALVLGASIERSEICLEVGVGTIVVALEREAARPAFGWMTQPIPEVSAYEAPGPLLEALGVPSAVLPVERYDNGPQHLLVAVDSFERVANLTPNLNMLAMLLPTTVVSVFAVENERVKTRVFAPGEGVPEDPATGSAAGPLALHLARHGVVPFGTNIEVEQGAELLRPSRLVCRAEGSPDAVEKVIVGGGGVLVARGEFRLAVSGL